MKKIMMGLLFVLLLLPISVLAGEGDSQAALDAELSAEDKAEFDNILEPVVKIYNFIKYIATVVGAIFLLYSGISFMTSGSDPRKRDMAKSIATYVILGLLIIWAAPMVVNLLI